MSAADIATEAGKKGGLARSMSTLRNQGKPIPDELQQNYDKACENLRRLKGIEDSTTTKPAEKKVREKAPLDTAVDTGIGDVGNDSMEEEGLEGD